MGRRTITALVLAGLLIPALVTGCGGGGGSAGGARTLNGVDISRQVELVIVPLWMGPPPRDLERVVAEANKITLEKLNCTISVQPMVEWMSRYQLALSSGEEIDLIWTAMWYSYQPMAFDGAWRDITEMVDQVAPELRSLIGEETWRISKIQGRDYAIPTNNRGWGQWGVSWREDLRKKMGTPPITSWETMEAYAEGIRKNYPNMIPFCDSGSGGLWHSFSEKSHYYVGLGNPQFSYGLGVKTDNPREFVLFHETPEFQEYITTQRRWVERGYVQPDVASNQDDGNDGMLSEKYAGNINTAVPASTLTSLIVPARSSHPDWEIGYMSFGEMFGWAYRSHPSFMAMAMPIAGKNPERTLLFIRELLTNRELYRLLDLGIEGVHYKIEDGYYVSLNDPVNPAFPQGGVGITNYLWREDFAVYSRDYQWVLDYNKNKLAPFEVTNYFEGFPEDYTAYNDRVTAMSEVNTQYTWPILHGAVPDPVRAMEEVNRRLDAAGRQDVVKSVMEQYNAYLDGLGVP